MKALHIFVLFLGLMVIAPQSHAAKDTPNRIQVSGEVIDTWCYVTEIMFAEGTAHHQCAVWCAVGGIPISILGDDGKVYVTNVNENAISVVDANSTTIWAADKQFIWTDGLYVAPDKSVVVTVNQLNRAPAFNGGVSGAEKPFKIFRVTQ